MTEFGKIRSPEKEQSPQAAVFALRMLGRIAILSGNKLLERLHIAPERPPTLYRILEESLSHEPQPLQPDIATVAQNIEQVLTEHASPQIEEPSCSEKIIKGGRMILFTDQTSSDKYPFLDYTDMQQLKDGFGAKAKAQQHPLSFDQQLSVALELFDGDIMRSLTNLCFTSRQYARWLDTVSIRGLPEFTDEGILQEMKEWRSSILACKNPDAANFQDPAGDTYYAWTHALSQVSFGVGSGAADRAGKRVFSYGTELMHTGVHTFTRQSVPSNHRVAADYGNRIGDTILKTVKIK